jgi:hypothetical protein
VIVSDPRKARKLSAEASAKINKQAQVRRTVEEILHNFKATGGSMTRSQIGLDQSLNSTGGARGILSMSGSLTSSRTSLAAVDNANGKPDPVAEILARARAKASKFRASGTGGAPVRGSTEQKSGPVDSRYVVVYT